MQRDTPTERKRQKYAKRWRKDGSHNMPWYFEAQTREDRITDKMVVRAPRVLQTGSSSPAPLHALSEKVGPGDVLKHAA